MGRALDLIAKQGWAMMSWWFEGGRDGWMDGYKSLGKTSCLRKVVIPENRHIQTTASERLRATISS